ncbi:8-oxo-dGDP phosphatase NUDT18-like [Oppia nitens]|uniref:8-oxo-dGDP phosphatase NUDT18-like n=1 Tax=Oppia nitens TaxID=1686743 RepID=UPI0023DC0286|nr:8-oxo-dGDP phosphatase NUDT18-like [Oppia nitens]
MDSIETQIKRLLKSQTVDDDETDNEIICDYSLTHQLKELAAKGVETSMTGEVTPVIGETVTYIAAAVVVNEHNEVLMMQEAKSKCAGQWYLPAGRVEPNEQIAEAVKREVAEETGLDFEPTTLLMVECTSGIWFRFTFTGRVVGGQLKSVAQADKESLQAQWVSDIGSLSLRSNDCLRLIEIGKQYKQNRDVWHRSQLVCIRSHNQMLMRVVCAIRRKENNRLHILVSEKTSPHIPVCEISPQRSVHAALKRFMQNIFKDNQPEHKPVGVLTVEHNGIPERQHDGLCLTILVIFRVPLEEAVPTNDYTWLQVEPELEGLIISRTAKYKTVNLFNK